MVRRSLAVRGVLRALIATVLLAAGCDHDPGTADIVAARAGASALTITYPQDETLFPPEIVAPTFTWKDETSGVDRWYLVVRDDAGTEIAKAAVDAPRWRPSDEDWKRIKHDSLER